LRRIEMRVKVQSIQEEEEEEEEKRNKLFDML
jgi:hypothetical protein